MKNTHSCLLRLSLHLPPSKLQIMHNSFFALLTIISFTYFVLPTRIILIPHMFDQNFFFLLFLILLIFSTDGLLFASPTQA